MMKIISLQMTFKSQNLNKFNEICKGIERKKLNIAGKNSFFLLLLQKLRMNVQLFLRIDPD